MRNPQNLARAQCVLEMLPAQWESWDGVCGSSVGTYCWDQRGQKPHPCSGTCQAPGDALTWEMTHG